MENNKQRKALSKNELEELKINASTFKWKIFHDILEKIIQFLMYIIGRGVLFILGSFLAYLILQSDTEKLKAATSLLSQFCEFLEKLKNINQWVFFSFLANFVFISIIIVLIVALWIKARRVRTLVQQKAHFQEKVESKDSERDSSQLTMTGETPTQ